MSFVTKERLWREKVCDKNVFIILFSASRDQRERSWFATRHSWILDGKNIESVVVSLLYNVEKMLSEGFAKENLFACRHIYLVSQNNVPTLKNS